MGDGVRDPYEALGVVPGASDAGQSAGELPLPEGFLVGHSTTARGDTGCTVVICPPGTRGGVDVRGGGTGTRELEPLSPLANAEGPTAVLMTGGSAFGLAAADGVVRWLEQRGLGRPTPIGVVPLVPTAVVFDLTAGEPGTRPGPDDGYAACEAARPGVPERGRVGAGAGAAVGKMLGREYATLAGVGYAAVKLANGVTVAAITVANASGDLLAEDGTVLGGPHGEHGELLRSAETHPADARAPQLGRASRPEHNPRVRVHRRDARQAQLRHRRAGRERGDREGSRPGLHPQRRRRRFLPRVRNRTGAHTRTSHLLDADRARHRRRNRDRHSDQRRNPPGHAEQPQHLMPRAPRAKHKSPDGPSSVLLIVRSEPLVDAARTDPSTRKERSGGIASGPSHDRLERAARGFCAKATAGGHSRRRASGGERSSASLAPDSVD
jgi:hypothetical protein